MDIVALIPVYNRKALTLQCVAQLLNQKCSGFTLKVVIIDDGSNDGTGAAIASQYPNVVVVRTNGDCWWTESINIGVKYALSLGCDYIYLANDDIIFNHDCIQQLYDCATTNGPYTIAGSAVLNSNTNKIFSTGYRLSGLLQETKPLNCGKDLDKLSMNSIQVHLLPGKSLLLPSTVFETTGMLDSKHFPHNCGDLEFTLRATRRGFRCIACPSSVVTSDINPNYLAIKIASTSKIEFLRCLTNRRYSFNIFNTFAVSLFFDRPYAIRCLSLIKQTARIAKMIILKMLLPNSILAAIYYSPAFETSDKR